MPETQPTMTNEQIRAEYDKLHYEYLGEKEPAKRAQLDRACDDFIERHAEAFGFAKTPAPPPPPKPKPPAPAPRKPAVELVREEARRVARELGIVDVERALAGVKLDGPGDAAIRGELVRFAFEHRETAPGRLNLTPMEVLEHYEAAVAARRDPAKRAELERVLREYPQELRVAQDARHRDRVAHEDRGRFLASKASDVARQLRDMHPRTRGAEQAARAAEAEALRLELQASPGTQAELTYRKACARAQEKRQAANAAHAELKEVEKRAEAARAEVETFKAADQ